MTETTFFIILLVNVSVTSLFAINATIQSSILGSSDYRASVQRALFLYQFKGFASLSCLLIAACTLDALHSGPLELVLSGFVFGLALALPNLALCSALSFAVSYILKWTISRTPSTARMQACIVAPGLFALLGYLFMSLA